MIYVYISIYIYIYIYIEMLYYIAGYRILAGPNHAGSAQTYFKQTHPWLAMIGS